MIWMALVIYGAPVAGAGIGGWLGYRSKKKWGGAAIGAAAGGVAGWMAFRSVGIYMTKQRDLRYVPPPPTRDMGQPMPVARA